MKIAIVGGTGLLGSNLVRAYTSIHDVKALSRSQSCNIDPVLNRLIDFSDLEGELCQIFDNWQPDVVINAVALVNLKECEQNKACAQKINVDIPVKLSKIASMYSCRFVQISTDHYYDDTQSCHDETTEIQLLNEYARTKYRAEQLVLETNNNSLVIRTNIIGFRRNGVPSFFEWLLDSLAQENPIELFTDFCTSSIDTKTFAEMLLKLVNKEASGIFNLASSSCLSKYDFGKKIAQRFGLKFDHVDKGSLVDFNKQSSVNRASNLGLDVNKIEELLGEKMPDVSDVSDNLYEEYLNEV